MADVAEHAPAADHDEYECPGCQQTREYQIAADVYGCPAGRRCTQATPEQRTAFEKQIAERLDAWRQDHLKES
jgi:ribosomal protein L37AE/L43A